MEEKDFVTDYVSLGKGGWGTWGIPVPFCGRELPTPLALPRLE